VEYLAQGKSLKKVRIKLELLKQGFYIDITHGEVLAGRASDLENILCWSVFGYMV
jgi:hypothetical protein